MAKSKAVPAGAVKDSIKEVIDRIEQAREHLEYGRPIPADRELGLLVCDLKKLLQ